ncbi:50S ribosomal protein L19 [Candidatus Microgenomates bacterium]|nr:50S ribosomal protein L19 [Candidatus Microgenomates bacterium]
MALVTKHNDVLFGVGDTIRLYLKTQEVGRRQALFEGTVIGIRGEGDNRTMTVRRIGADRIGIEQIFPLASPWIQKVEVKEHRVEGVRQAKLYFLRGSSKAVLDKISHRAQAKGKTKVVGKKRAKVRAKKRKTSRSKTKKK